MTSTLNMIKNCFCLRAKELLTIAFVALFGFLLGHGMLRAVMTFDKSADLATFEAGTMMGVMAIFFATIFTSSANYANHIGYAVSMGKRRKDAITAHLFLATAKSLVATSLIYIFHIIESYVCRTTYAAFPEEINLDELFTFEAFFVFMGLLIALENFMGAMQTRFGQKVYWILLLICMSVCFVPTLIEKGLEGNSDNILSKIGSFIVNTFSQLNLNMVLVGAGVIIILLIASPYVILRKYRLSM